MRILIAEDDQVLADGLLRTLRSSGAAVAFSATAPARVDGPSALLSIFMNFHVLPERMRYPAIHAGSGIRKQENRLIRMCSGSIKATSLRLTVKWQGE